MAEGFFPRDLYQRTARYYDRYRYAYPPVLVAHLVRHVATEQPGRLLDLACGTGQVTFPLAPFFRQVVGVDQEPEMIALAADKARTQGVAHVCFLVGAVETVDVGPEPFTVITVGNAFHRLPRDCTARRMRSWLSPGGHVVLLWAHTPWNGSRPWQTTLRHIIEEWQRCCGDAARVPPGRSDALAARTHQAVLESWGFTFVGRYTFPIELHFTVEQLIGTAPASSA